jgi:hypothetical protein
MKDVLFIENLIERGKVAGEKVKAEFGGLALEQLNWKPAPESWSIGQCLDHLIVTDCLYFPSLKTISEGNYSITRWQRWSPFSSLFGKILVNQLQEKAKSKVKTAKIFYPSSSEINEGIFDRFHKHLDTLIEYITACKEVDLDKINITSPVSTFITYNLRHAFMILIQHEHRHINQAVRVKGQKEFPR